MLVEEDSRSLVVDLSIEPDTNTAVLRGSVEDVLRDLGEDHRYDVLLVITELAANVLDHAGGVGRLRIFRSPAPCRTWVEVDDGSEQQPVPGHSRLGSDRGRGMVMVNGISQEWGPGRGPAAARPCTR
ncbi:hypothetical protein [Nocardia sp. NRRL S-836]|uniref:ATP-binding protein n=1 Tax=Nocardia sp. NRRL S-836 TaxID=1519492 RepID=UPI0006AE5FE3|nr:hypothetical protein [Nocardia sp. NRRL S-836]